MSRVLSIARLMEAREEIVKRKKYRKEREEMRLELTAAQADIAKAAFDEQPSSKPHQSQSVLPVTINESEVSWHAVVLCYMRPICSTRLRRHPVLVVGAED